MLPFPFPFTFRLESIEMAWNESEPPLDSPMLMSSVEDRYEGVPCLPGYTDTEGAGTGDGCGLLKYEPPLIRSEGIKGEDKYAESIEGGRE